MSLEQEIKDRSGNKCELCSATNNLTTFTVPATNSPAVDNSIYICATCSEQINDKSKMDANHWRCLNDSMWSEVDAVKVMAWRILNRLKTEGWPQDLLDMMYLEDDVKKWAEAEGDGDDEKVEIIHKDCNGAVLSAGDSVTVIKDLNVKGSSLVAKRGTAVRNISLVYDNAEQIEGKVEGQHIVILTQYVKKN